MLAALSTLPVTRLTLTDALGAIVASDLTAHLDLPPFDNAAVDGYAVCAQDVARASVQTPAVLKVVGLRLAGDGRPLAVEPGVTAKVMTGAPLPSGADAMVMVEDAEAVAGEADMVALKRAVQPGAGVRSAGSDIARGALVMRRGTALRPAHLGVLASLGLSQVDVYKRPRVGVMSTGDELAPAGSVLSPGQIHDSNRVLLAALVRAAGFEAIDLGCIPDDRARIEEALRLGAATCDSIVCSGGVSMGDVDLVRAVLADIGDLQWMQLAIKPAKPFAFAMLDGIPVFGLPGNPVSSLVSFHLLALPGLRLMAGHEEPNPEVRRGVAAGPFRRKRDGKDHYVRATCALDEAGRTLLTPLARQGSHQLLSSADADVLAVVPDGDGRDAGEQMEFIELVGG